MRSIGHGLRRLVFATIVTGCAAAGQSPGGPRPVDQVADRLFFGRAIPDGGIVTDSAWDVFLRDVITPAFPAGLTVWRAEGQWLDPRGTLVKEPVMVVEVMHPKGAPADSVFERIANTYRVQFQQDAVLRTSTPARVWLYERR